MASRMSTTKTRVSVPLMPADGEPGRAVALVGRDHEQDLGPDGLAHEALVPAGDDLPGADRELHRAARLPRRVEHLAVPAERAGVLHVDGLAGLDHGTVTLDERLHDRGRSGGVGRRHGDRGLAVRRERDGRQPGDGRDRVARRPASSGVPRPSRRPRTAGCRSSSRFLDLSAWCSPSLGATATSTRLPTVVPVRPSRAAGRSSWCRARATPACRRTTSGSRLPVRPSTST